MSPIGRKVTINRRQTGLGVVDMSVTTSLQIGFVAGIALFFVLQRLGIIDRWFERWNR